MKWSLPLARIKGIDLKVHVTFPLLLIWVAIQDSLTGVGPAQVFESIAFILALFVCVIFHEFGHALTAARYGIRTSDVTLLPIGGVARLERMPEDPKQEFMVAIAGPLVNVVIAGVLFLLAAVSIGLRVPTAERIFAGHFLTRLMTVNVALVVFNMLPAFPMDGGRIVRSLLALKLEYSRATAIAGSLGQAMALIFGFLGFFGNPFLILIAVFVWMGATQETHMAQMRAYFSGTPVREATVTDFRTVGPNEHLREVVQLLLTSTQEDFPVVEGDKVLGLITRDRLSSALQEHGEEYPVRAAMRTDYRMLDASESLQNAFMQMQQEQAQTYLVFSGDRLYGLLTTRNLGEFISVRSALSKQKRATGGDGEAPAR